tara:strand:- start:431 stop:2248 length:1818 start_codon:yes stop_codon:yes gene_type:complete
MAQKPQAPSAGFDMKVPKNQQQFSWTTQKVEQLMIALDDGYKPASTPFYEGNPNLRKGNIVFNYSDQEIQEIKRCAKDIVYFANTYCTVMTDHGLQTITLRPYQEVMLRQFQAERFNVCLASRQIGKTICSSIFIAWYSVFNFDKNSLILSNKGATTREIIDKGKTILEHLPFFIKPGTLKWDVFNSKFDNGCRIIGQTTTKKAAIGFTIHLLFMDEFAHIPANFVDTFYENVYPTVSASTNSKVIITSTPNGFNKFYDIYTAADKGLSEYTPFRVDWWDVPGRDDAWARQEVANLGSDEAFNRQYGNQFIAGSSLLLGAASLKKLTSNQLEFEHKEIPEFDEAEIDYSGLLWLPGFNLDEIEEDYNYWVFSVDIAEGVGGDYSVINIFQVKMLEEKDWLNVTTPGSFVDFFSISQVGRFRSNEHTIEEFAKSLYILTFDLFFSENVKLIIEWNMFGGELLKRMETVFPQRNDFDEESVVKFKHRIDAKTKQFGLKVKSDNKPIFCQNFKKYISQNKIQIFDKETVKESSTFGKLPNGSYAGQLGNDDLIMTCINSSEFFTTLDFSDFVEEIYDNVDVSVQTKIDKILEKDSKGGNLNFDIYDLV